MIGDLLSGLLPALIALAGAVAGIAAAFFAGRRSAGKDRQIQDLEDAAATRRRIDDAPVASDAADARRRLRKDADRW